MTAIFVVFAVVLLIAASVSAYVGFRRHRIGESGSFWFGMTTGYVVAVLLTLLYMGLVKSMLRNMFGM